MATLFVLFILGLLFSLWLSGVWRSLRRMEKEIAELEARESVYKARKLREH